MSTAVKDEKVCVICNPEIAESYNEAQEMIKQGKVCPECLNVRNFFRA